MELDHSPWLEGARLTGVVGHFGTGKTELAVNMALALAGRGRRVALADLDIVDPYFRSRECRQVLEGRGVALITSSQACADADVPAVPAQVQALFEPQGGFGILDLGGDASGVRVLARFRRGFLQAGGRLLCVVNGSRPLSDTADKALSYLEQIQDAAGLPIDGLVNNTHLCDRTREEDILFGAELAREVSRRTGIPLVCHMVRRELISRLPPMDEPVFPITLYMKKPWE